MKNTKIKICGLLRPEDARAVNEAMPDYVGFIFYDKSRRAVTQQQAQALRMAIDPAIKTVGVFVNESHKRIAALYQEGIIQVIQLHGEESNDEIAALRTLLPTAEIWKAFLVRSRQELAAAEQSMADLVLLDNGFGTGAKFDWSLLTNFHRPFLLAGGLTPQNIPEAMERFHPFALDVSTGVETAGVKDPCKIFAAVAAVRMR